MAGIRRPVDSKSRPTTTVSVDPEAVQRLIAIVDDDVAVRIAIDSLLRSLGHHCLMYESAEALLASLGAKRIACVICDIRMEGMSGLDLAEVLSARCPPIPVVLITAHSSAETDTRAAAAGALCVLPKPFDRQALLIAVAQALGS